MGRCARLKLIHMLQRKIMLQQHFSGTLELLFCQFNFFSTVIMIMCDLSVTEKLHSKPVFHQKINDFFSYLEQNTKGINVVWSC